MGKQNKVEVVIGGEIITIISDENDDYIQKLASYIDRKMGEIRISKSDATLNDRTRTLLIAVNIADDFYKMTDKYMQVACEHEAILIELNRIKEENALLRESAQGMQSQIDALQTELDAYLGLCEQITAPHEGIDNVVSMNRLIVKQ